MSSASDEVSTTVSGSGRVAYIRCSDERVRTCGCHGAGGPVDVLGGCAVAASGVDHVVQGGGHLSGKPETGMVTVDRFECSACHL